MTASGMTAALLVGLDIGTTSAKAVVFASDGRPLATGRAATHWRTTATGTETTAASLRDAAFAALAAALDAAPEGRVIGVGVASLAESGVLLDAEDRSIAPVIAWYDTRDARELEALDEELGAEGFSAVTGLPRAQQWSLTKSRWLSHDLDLSRARRRLSVAEWIAYALGGRAASEPSLASRTGWLDLARREWWDAALQFSRVRRSWLPDLTDAGTDLGAVTAAVHSRLTGARIAVAGHDHQVAAVGAGAWSSGDVLDSCGTAEALVRTANPGLAPSTITALTGAGITVGWHALPGHWCLLGATEGGRALGRTLEAIGVRDVSLGLDAAARALPPPSVRIDSATPANRIAALVGDGLAPEMIWRGAVEGVTAEAQRLDACMSASSGPSRRVIAVGGWTASTALIDAKRRRLGTVEVPELAEAGSRGAALFAGVAAGLWRSVTSSAW
ncbi:FGGY family carbohydrate kinase [Leucobacter rhizosphaerae]|uniref:FGGY family carbohydrate kinase n=1 Tax=Leucobacter rhizosphaerae TaxID=2932245 RepID=A0ABY4FVX9_9MICO|nr:FGGY family carbohydrate kinase [Leucobacter rhizosphaerae]UOQ60470.1 FGGY family carbohydrate kinase [Leucobacter rhizosphaerae]